MKSAHSTSAATDRRLESSPPDQCTAGVSVGSLATLLHDSFYGPLLAAGSIPGEDEIPESLLQAMAILIGRSLGGYIDPTECRGPAALVLLASGNHFSALDSKEKPPQAQEKKAGRMCIQNMQAASEEDPR